jgi:hypothetical protein
MFLSRAVSVANFLEQNRPDSPAYVADAKDSPYIESFVREVEIASAELISSYHAVAPRRPVWANRR